MYLLNSQEMSFRELPLNEGRTFTKRSAVRLLDCLAMKAVCCAKELVEASSEVQGGAGQVAASLASEESMPL